MSFYRKIPVHDTHPEIFKLFLEFLYGGKLEMSELSTEQLSDLLVLADRYEVCIFSKNSAHICVGVYARKMFIFTFIAKNV